MDERVCIVCGATFMPKTHQQKCCSVACSSRNANAKKEEYRRAKGERELAAIERVCTVCGATFTPISYNQICCSEKCKRENFLVKNREYHKRKRAEKKASAAEEKKATPKTEPIFAEKRKSVCDSYCDGCVFLTWANGNTRVCEYLFMTNRRRPCFAGKGCTVKQTGKKKSTWRYEADETWEVKKKAERKKLTQGKEVFHRECPVCGKIFETTKSQKIYCCQDCAIKGKMQKDVVRQALYRSLVEKDTYHRICPECGTEFDTENMRKFYCCRKCMLRYTQRQRIRQKNGIHPNGDANND